MSESARLLLGGDMPQPVQPQVRQPYKQERPERQQKKKTKINEPRHTVFFYSIPFSLPDEEFGDFARQYGEIMNLHSVIKEKGQAFATYYDIRDAQRAVSDAQDKELGGRRISSNFVFFPPNLGNKKDQMPSSANVLVRTVDGSIMNESEVSDALKDFGEIHSVVPVPPNYMVKFFNIKSAKEAVSNSRNCKTPSGKILDISLYSDNENNHNGNNTNKNVQRNNPPPSQYNNFHPGYSQYPPYPPMAPPQYGAPQYGMPPPMYGQSPYGMPPPPPGAPNAQGGQAPPMYGQPPYGMPPPMYGQSPYGMPPQQQPQQQQAQPPKSPEKPNDDGAGQLNFLKALVLKNQK